MLTSLYEYLRQLQSKSNSEQFYNLAGSETSQTVKEMMQVKQLENRIKEVDKVSKKILDDLQGYENINQQVTEMLQDLKVQQNDLFQSWVGEIITLIKDKTLSLRESDPVVQFSQQKYMKVNYSSRFVTLINEVRQLRTMGFHIPSRIEETSDHARKFMKHARILEQVKLFYCNIPYLI